MASDARLRVIVTKLHRAEHGEYEARVNLDGNAIEVTREFGSWMVKKKGGGLADVPHWLAAELQSRLPAEDRRLWSGRRREKETTNAS